MEVRNISHTATDHSITLNWDNPDNSKFQRVAIFEGNTYLGSSSNGTFTHSPLYAQSTHTYRLIPISNDGIIGTEKTYTATVGSRASGITWRGIAPVVFDSDYNSYISLPAGNHYATWEGNLAGKIVTIKIEKSFYWNGKVAILDSNNQRISVTDLNSGTTATQFTVSGVKTYKFVIPENATKIHVNVSFFSGGSIKLYEIQEN